MSSPIIKVTIRSEHDTVSARQRARQISRLLGFDAQDQTRISTAVSEIARNAFNYAGGGQVEYSLEGKTAPQLLIIKVQDSGPGISNLEDILSGRYESRTGMGMGILGARRLMDQFQIQSVPGTGTTVWLRKLLPKRAGLFGPLELSGLASALAAEGRMDAFQELQHQNQELLRALEEIRSRQMDLKQLNRELEDTNRGVVALYAELDEKADHLRRADELKSRFLSNMSHEFRSPLNSILALSGLLLDGADGALNGEQNQQVAYIRKAAQDLLELVNDLLDLAKVEAGKVEARPTAFHVKNLFAALRGMLKPLLVNQSVDLVFEDAEDIPELFSDEGKVSQILRNFISNALKFTERGEVRVSAALAADDQIVFSVADTGIGIASTDLDVIFKDFTQLDHAIQRRVKGTGLGLPLSKQLAALLGGSVSVQSEPGVGSVFSVRIPLRIAGEAEPAPAALEECEAEPGIPVLIVEDSVEMMMMYKSYLRGSNFRLIPASTTRDAREVVDRLLPRAIVLDVVLRSEDTWRFLADLKQDPQTRNIPVLIASTVEDQGKGYHLGADDYMLKPVERRDLLRRLEFLIGRRPATRILLIDDDELDRYLMKQHLKDGPMTILEANSGREGIRQANAEKPDLIVLDLSMPGQSGFEILEQLKMDQNTQNIPVVICTSRILSDSERTQLSKAAAILNKARLNRVDVLRTIERALDDATLTTSAS